MSPVLISTRACRLVLAATAIAGTLLAGAALPAAAAPAGASAVAPAARPVKTRTVGHLVFTAQAKLPNARVTVDLGTLLLNGSRPAGLGAADLSALEVKPFLHEGTNTISLAARAGRAPASRYTAELVLGPRWAAVTSAKLDVADLVVNGRAIPDPATLDLRHLDITSYLVPGANTVDVPIDLTVARAR